MNVRTYDVYTDTYTFTAYTRSSRVSFTPLDPNWCRRMRIQSSPHTHRRLLSIFLELCWYMYIYIHLYKYIYTCTQYIVHTYLMCTYMSKWLSPMLCVLHSEFLAVVRKRVFIKGPKHRI